MRKKHSISVPVFILFVILLVGVLVAVVGVVQKPQQSRETAQIVAGLAPTQSVEALEAPAITETLASVTVEPTATPTQEPTATPTLEPTPTEEVVADYCVECHTDKEELIATAKEEEPAESESKGVG